MKQRHKGLPQVIDCEFAFCGPMAFDIGKLIGNLLLAYFASAGHADPEQPRCAQGHQIRAYQGPYCFTTTQMYVAGRRRCGGDMYIYTCTCS